MLNFFYFYLSLPVLNTPLILMGIANRIPNENVRVMKVVFFLTGKETVASQA